MKSLTSLRAIAAIAAAGALTASLAACGGSSDNSGSSDDGEKVTLNVWGWGNQWKPAIKGFEKENPNIKIKFNNTGTASDTATALENAVEAGSGAPDVVTLEDTGVPQFALSEALTDLSPQLKKIKSDFTPGPLSKLTVGGKIYGAPIDSAPLTFFYNKAVFDKAGIKEAPKTWDEYYEDAKKVKALGATSFITNDAGDKDAWSPFNGMMWEAGATPYKVKGEKVTINLTKSDPGVKRHIDFKQRLIDEKLVDTKTKQWSDDWFRGLGDGSIATLTIGGWMPVNLESSAPNAKGDWRVAQLPQWEEGSKVSAEDGGSALAVVKSSQKQEAAWKLVEYMTHGDGAQISVDEGGVFPALKSILTSDEFTSVKNEYFGGQQVNKLLGEAAQREVSEYQFLPYSTYAQSVYGDIVGKAYSGKTSVEAALKKYQSKLVEYGNSQGFKVNK